MGGAGLARPFLPTAWAGLVKARTLYILHATRQGGFEVFRAIPHPKGTHGAASIKHTHRLQALQSCADNLSIHRWFNSTPSLFLHASEWRVIADYADPISGHIRIPKLSRHDSQRFLKQGIRRFEPQAIWQQAIPLFAPSLLSPLSTSQKSSNDRAHAAQWARCIEPVQHWLSKKRLHWIFPDRWVIHALPPTMSGQHLHSILADLAQRPKTRIKGPFVMADILAHHRRPFVESASNVDFNENLNRQTCLRIAPMKNDVGSLDSAAALAFVSVQQGQTVLFSRQIENTSATPAKLFPTLYAHQLLDRQHDAPAIETLAAGIYPNELLHALAHPDALKKTGIPAFSTPHLKPELTAPRSIRQWLKQRPLTSTLAIGLLTVSLLTGASVFRPTHTIDTPPPRQNPAAMTPPPPSAMATEHPESLVEPATNDGLIWVNLDAPLPNTPAMTQPSVSTESSSNDSYGWIRRSDGMVLRWQGPLLTGDGETMNTVAPQNAWSLRRVQP